jgi:ABC-2 type transport system ATP-binding protein
VGDSLHATPIMRQTGCVCVNPRRPDAQRGPDGSGDDRRVDAVREHVGEDLRVLFDVMTEGIVLTGLTKTHRGPTGPVRAVRGIDLSIHPGETVALLGPNGAGKTTTIDVLLGLSPADAGTATVFGRSPREAVDAGLVGGMLQTGTLIGGATVRELITLIASLYPHPLDISETTAAIGLSDVADRRTDKLSGGQTQRVRAALALVADSELMVLDEPTVALDVEGRHDFWVRIRDYAASGKTVLFATHYLEEADANADRIVLMAHGRIVADGSPTEIKARVGGRTIRATLPDVAADELTRLPGVSDVQRRGESIVVACEDSDRAIRALLDRYPQLHDIEIAGAALEDAFLALTAGDDEADSTPAGEPIQAALS